MTTHLQQHNNASNPFVPDSVTHRAAPPPLRTTTTSTLQLQTPPRSPRSGRTGGHDDVLDHGPNSQGTAVPQDNVEVFFKMIPLGGKNRQSYTKYRRSPASTIDWNQSYLGKAYRRRRPSLYSLVGQDDYGVGDVNNGSPPPSYAKSETLAHLFSYLHSRSDAGSETDSDKSSDASHRAGHLYAAVNSSSQDAAREAVQKQQIHLIEQLQIDIASLRSEMHQRQQSVSQKEHECASYLIQHHDLIRSDLALTGQDFDAEDDIDWDHFDHADLSRKLQPLYAALRQQLLDFRERHENYDVVIDLLRAQEQTQVRSIKDMESLVADLKGKHQVEIEKLQRAADELTTNLEKQVLSDVAEKDKLRQTITQLNEMHLADSNTAEERIAEKDELIRSLREATRQEIESLKARFEEGKEEADRLYNTLRAESQTEIKSLNFTLDAKREEVSNLKACLEEAGVTARQAAESHAKQLEKTDALVSKLKEEIRLETIRLKGLEGELHQKADELEARENALRETMEGLARRETKDSEEADLIGILQQALSDKEIALVGREADCKKHELELIQSQAALAERESKAMETVALLSERERALDMRHVSLGESAVALSAREGNAVGKEAELSRKMEYLNRKQAFLDEEADRLEQRDSGLAERERALDGRLADATRDAQEQRRALKQERCLLEQEKQELEKQRGELAQKLHEANNDEKIRKQNAEVFLIQKKEIEIERKNIEEEKERLDFKTQALTQERNSLQRERQELEQQKRSLDHEKQDVSELKTSLERQQQGLTQQKQDLEQREISAIARDQGLTQREQSLREKASQDASGLELQCERLREQQISIDQQQQDILTQRAQIAEQRQALASESEALSARTAQELAAIESQRCGLKSREDSFESQVLENSQRAEKQQHDLNSKEAKLQKLEEALVNQQVELDSLKAEHKAAADFQQAALRKHQEEEIAKEEALNRQVSEQDTAARAREQELDARESQIRAREDELNAKDKLLSTQEQQLNSHKQALDGLDLALHTQEDELQTIRQRLEESEKSFAEKAAMTTKKHEDISSELKAKAKGLTGLQASLERQLQERKLTQEEISNKQRELTKWQTEMERRERELNELRSKLSNAMGEILKLQNRPSAGGQSEISEVQNEQLAAFRLALGIHNIEISPENKAGPGSLASSAVSTTSTARLENEHSVSDSAGDSASVRTRPSTGATNVSNAPSSILSSNNGRPDSSAAARPPSSYSVASLSREDPRYCQVCHVIHETPPTTGRHVYRTHKKLQKSPPTKKSVSEAFKETNKALGVQVQAQGAKDEKRPKKHRSFPVWMDERVFRHASHSHEGHERRQEDKKAK